MSDFAEPRVSCVLPVYNGEQFVEEAVRSILDQSFTDFELVVVDDGSTDSTPQKLKTLADSDKRVRVLSQSNGGIVSALNTGLQASRGIYIARMDADDISMTDRFSFQVDYLDKNPDCVLVGGVARSIAMQDSAQRFATGGRHERTDLSLFPPRIAVSIHPLIMVRTAALRAIGGYRDTYPHAEDYDLFIRLSIHGTIDNPPKEILFYRRHADAISIKNADIQERSAVRAECEAMDAAGYGMTANWIIESYIRLRIFRRMQTIDLVKASAMAGQILQDSIHLGPSRIFSCKYSRLRVILIFNLAKFVVRRIRSSISRARGCGTVRGFNASGQ